MKTTNFYCKRCGAEIYPGNAQEEYGDIFIACVKCQAKNVVVPYIFNKTVILDLWQITGWRD
jgi:DNA-directed RNA polymerase subunit RPC12/RpoP